MVGNFDTSVCSVVLNFILYEPTVNHSVGTDVVMRVSPQAAVSSTKDIGGDSSPVLFNSRITS